MIVWLFYALSCIFMELVYHIGCFGIKGGSIWFPFAIIAILSSVQTLIIAFIKGKIQKILFWAFPVFSYLIFATQAVYFTVFKQPLQLRAAFLGGGDALTVFWKEALAGVGKTLPLLVLLALPLIIVGVYSRKKKLTLPQFENLQKVRICFVLGVSIIAFYMVSEIGKYIQADYYVEYSEFYAPLVVLERSGVLTMVQRDISYEINVLWEENVESAMAPGETAEFVLSTPVPEITALPQVTEAPISESGETQGQEGMEVSEPTPTPQPIPQPYVYDLDLVKLADACVGDKEKEWLAQYIVGQIPTKQNEYSGIFQDYNLIFLTAEGFSTYAVDEELTPTLYKLANSGFVFNNYYVPLWQTSTSDGEYINCSALIPDGQFSMRKSASNNMPYTLPKFFAMEGCESIAYHNNTLSYYERHLTHPNLGYLFKASKLGECSSADWSDNLFVMENPDRWPASDLEMIQATVPEYIDKERFHVYYMTISGHMYYSFSGNSMSSKNKDAVKGLDMSENARAYIACNIELDKALENLILQLEASGKLENTVIVLSADHYPYGMTKEQYEELAGKSLAEGMDMFRNTLILWNAGMEETIVVDKVCGSMDLIPTISNLFGFPFDSRMYAGRDIFSQEEGLVIFNDRSFVTDTVSYNAKTKETIWKKELAKDEQKLYLEEMKQEVKDRYQFSAYILRENFYDIIENCRN